MKSLMKPWLTCLRHLQLRTLVFFLVVVFTVATLSLPVSTVLAQGMESNPGLVNDSKVDLTPLPANDPQTVWDTGLNIAFAVIASLAVLSIVINGFMYILASGDQQKTARARQGVIYSAVGLGIVVLAQVIVTFAVKGAT